MENGSGFGLTGTAKALVSCVSYPVVSLAFHVPCLHFNLWTLSLYTVAQELFPLLGSLLGIKCSLKL